MSSGWRRPDPATPAVIDGLTNGRRGELELTAGISPTEVVPAVRPPTATSATMSRTARTPPARLTYRVRG